MDTEIHCLVSSCEFFLVDMSCIKNSKRKMEEYVTSYSRKHYQRRMKSPLNKELAKQEALPAAREISDE